MAGIELHELVLFAKQIGLAVAGAGALWGVVFARRRCPAHPSDRCVILDWFSGKLFAPIAGGATLALGAWATLLFTLQAEAHEGIALSPAFADIIRSQMTVLPVMLALGVAVLVAWMLRRNKQAMFYKALQPLYALIFLFSLTAISMSVWTGEWSRVQVFFIGHSAHSIFTVGTVLVLDFLYLVSRTSTIMKQHIYPLFPTITKVILVGLGLDFLSGALVFGDAIALTPKFFFMQTVLAVIIINGVFLAGPLARKMPKMEEASGAVSISSWLTITLVDFFHTLTLGYAELLSLYALFVVAAYVVHTFAHKFWEQEIHEVLVKV